MFASDIAMDRLVAGEHTREGSRHNIHSHYDLGNDFYRLWLDSQLVYTCAYFPSAAATLEEAQTAKLDYVCRKLHLQPGETVVEAGCGWGALALHIARNYGVHEQIRYAQQRADEENLNDRVEFIEDDYRNVSGKFDVFVSVGMLEHVGAENYPALGSVIHRTIGDQGRGLLHFIGRTQQSQFSPWIRKRIFPGAYVPSLREALEVLEPFGYFVHDVEDLRPHYARTLEHWLDRFEKSAAQVLSTYGAEFERAWRLYLAGSIAGGRGSRMDSCDILIVGGGPAGSSCAWALRNSGLDVAIIDRQVFPRDKVCGGWITPGVLTALHIDAGEYGSDHVLQPITGFRTSCIGHDSQTETDYGRTVSYGIRRREFDDYLLKRCGARLNEGVGLSSLNRSGESWIANGRIRARLAIGAGGHFCPVARLVGGGHTGTPVAAQETEFEMDAHQFASCDMRGSRPELYFCADMKGYGWCFRKRNVLNIGLGRADPHGIAEPARAFIRLLAATGRVPFEVPALKGHAYFLYGTSQRQIAGDGFLLIGDSVGLARPQSGEGILPAIRSGLLAAETILAAGGTELPKWRPTRGRWRNELEMHAMDG